MAQMSEPQSPFAGACVFGTAQGLTIRGVGCFAQPGRDLMRILEFGTLKLATEESVWFDLPYEAGGGKGRIVGKVGFARDYKGREGFAGIALAVTDAALRSSGYSGAVYLLEQLAPWFAKGFDGAQGDATLIQADPVLTQLRIPHAVAASVPRVVEPLRVKLPVGWQTCISIPELMGFVPLYVQFADLTRRGYVLRSREDAVHDFALTEEFLSSWRRELYGPGERQALEAERAQITAALDKTVAAYGEQQSYAAKLGSEANEKTQIIGRLQEQVQAESQDRARLARELADRQAKLEDALRAHAQLQSDRQRLEAQLAREQARREEVERQLQALTAAAPMAMGMGREDRASAPDGSSEAQGTSSARRQDVDEGLAAIREKIAGRDRDGSAASHRDGSSGNFTGVPRPDDGAPERRAQREAGYNAPLSPRAARSSPPVDRQRARAATGAESANDHLDTRGLLDLSSMRKFDSAGRSFAEKLHIPRTTEGWQGAARGFARKALDVLGQRKPAVLKKPAAKDAVDCSVFAPPSAPPGETILVQVFLHVPEQSARAQFMASVMDASTTFKGVQSLEVAVPRGARVTAALSVADAEVDEPQQSVVWRGEPVFAQFLLRLPERAAGSALYPVVRISVGGALVGRISFRISLDAGASRPKSEPRGDSAKRYQHAFLSYAATDRREVLKRAQVLKAAGVGFFQDVLSLDPGDRWQREIYRHIDRCDLFLLFWSKAARDSEWVIREAEYALARQRTGEEPDIVPVILEGPPVILPPESLKELHFNDRINYLIAMS